MGRHSKEGDSLSLATTALPGGRHRNPHRRFRRFHLTALFHRARHRPHAEHVNEFGHTGATVGWGGTLTGIVATTKPGMKPVNRPRPLRPVQEALGPVPISQFFEPDPALDAPTEYRSLTALNRPTQFVLVQGRKLYGVAPSGV